MKTIWVAVRMTLATIVLTGLVYPLAVTAVARVAFPRRASGSLVESRGRVVGSALIGQRFTGPGSRRGSPKPAGETRRARRR